MEDGFELLVEHTWKIENFTLWDTDAELESHGFGVESMPETEFHLSVVRSEVEDGGVVCRLNGATAPDGAKTCRIGFQFSVLAEDGTAFTTDRQVVEPFAESCSEGVRVFGLDALEADRLVPDDVLTLVCRMWEVRRLHVPCALTVEESLNKYRSNNFTFFAIKKSREVSVPKAAVYDAVGTGRPIVMYDVYVYDDHAPNEKAAIRFFSNTSRVPLLVHVTIHLLDCDKRRCLSKSHRHVFWNDLEVWYFPEFIPIKLLLENRSTYLPDERIYFEIDIHYSFTDTSLTSFWCGSNSVMHLRDVQLQYPEGRSGKRKRDLKRDMLTLYKKRKFTDLVLTAEGQRFPTHKAILSARSSVFGAMFELDMAEKQSSVVDIQDMDSETLRLFLGFLYSESFPDDDLNVEGASKLYSAADKYDIRELREKCSDFLRSKLISENACEILMLAHFHGDRELKKSALDKISGCLDSIILTDEWASLVQGESTLAESALSFLRCKR